jgi:hypothetical protein
LIRTASPVIASEAKQSRAAYDALDCFVALLLAMTAKARLKSVRQALAAVARGDIVRPIAGALALFVLFGEVGIARAHEFLHVIKMSKARQRSYDVPGRMIHAIVLAILRPRIGQKGGTSC